VKYEDLADEFCSVARAVSLLGDRWTFMILREAFLGVRRFDQMQARLGISRRLLSDRLTLLVEAGVFQRCPYADERRTRHEYRLTAKGMDLYPVVLAMRTFADQHMSPEGPIVVSRHKDCTGVAQIHVTCSDCGHDLVARDVTAEPGPGMRVAQASAAAGAGLAAELLE
jgi:DNA-binding HxlR family transcriptional regulator